MKLLYKPKSALEKFGNKIYDQLVENFPQTFFVGGMVRDLLLNRQVTDIDIATQATPEKVCRILSFKKIVFEDRNKNFGSIVAGKGKYQIEITSLRKDLPSRNRYPKVEFVNNPKIDSKRRDFTINSLYLRQYSGKILDFQSGLKDLKRKQIKFIGNPKQRILEDPLRIIRALRFALVLNFKLDVKARQAIKNNFMEVKKLTRTKIKKEIEKIKNKKKKNILKKVINNPKLLDKYFKSS